MGDSRFRRGNVLGALLHVCEVEMGHKFDTMKYAFLTLTGIVLLSGALWHAAVLPTVQACGSNPNCEGWEVTQRRCDGLCSCAGNLISYTCYEERGVCNSDGGGGGGGDEGGDGDWCFGDSDCELGNICENGVCGGEQ